MAAAIGIGLLLAALITELRKPPRERSWHGAVAGQVPYDLRPPTLARVRSRLWDPSDRRVIVPTAFGVGWTVNLAAVRQLIAG